MRIKVLFFAQLREAFGMTEHVVEVNSAITVGEMTEHICKTVISRPSGREIPKEEISRFTRNDGGFKGIPLLYAVNENFVEADEVLKDGDTLALMTPVAGG